MKSRSRSFFRHAVLRHFLLAIVVGAKPARPQPVPAAAPAGRAPETAQDSLAEYLDKVRVPVQDLDKLSDTAAAGISPAPFSPSPASATVPAQAEQPPPQVAPRPSSARGWAAEKGLVLAAETGKPVPQALVLLIGEKERYSAQSDADGLYALTHVRPGRYRLKAGKRGFAFLELEGLEFLPGDGPLREIRLERSMVKGQLIEAKGGGNAGGAASLMSARRSSTGVMDGVSAEQIAKSSDADAGAVAKRITGTSLVGGRYIYVRGLGERYTNMTLNGLPLPSPEKDKRVVPQDLFPASALDRFILYKTFSPELYGDFAGGSVALETKGMPEKRFFKITAGQGGTDYVGDGDFLNYGQERLSYAGGETFWGFDDGTRALPSGVPAYIPDLDDKDVPRYRALGLPASTRAERAAYAVAFSNVYAADTVKVRPNRNYSLSFGDVRAVGEGGRAGYVVGLGFKNRYNQRDRFQSQLGSVALKHLVTEYSPLLGKEITRLAPLVDTLPGMDTLPSGAVVRRTQSVVRLAPGINRSMRSGTYEATLTGLANFGWEPGPDHRLFWKNFYANLGADESNITISKADSSGALNQDRPVEERHLLEFNRRDLFSSQVGGGHYLGLGPADSCAWAAGYSRTTGETPDSRKYMYTKESDSAAAIEYRNDDVWGTRVYENLAEDALSARSDFFLSIPPSWSARDVFLPDGRVFAKLRLPEARTGFSGSARRRAFAVSRYAYDTDRNIYNNTTVEAIRDPRNLRPQIEQGLKDFRTSPKSHDEYEATEGLLAGYFSAASGFSLLGLPVDLEAGARCEYYRLDFASPFTGVSLGTDIQAIEDSTILIDRRQWEVLPSLGATLHPWSSAKLLVHFGRTLTRPEFREIAPYTYYDYLSGRDVSGNGNLRQTKIRHWDLRWDWYFPAQQLISVSLFDKAFTDPIEVVVDLDRSLRFQNAVSAYVRGIEFEGNLDLYALAEALGLPFAAGKGVSLYGNLALMHSGVRLDTTLEGAGNLTSNSRSMVGQSPFLLNLKLAHEAEGKRFAVLNALLFNVAGERIKEAGVGGAPDIYEQPFPGLDYLGKLTFFKRVELAWTVKNLLGRKKRFTGYEFNPSKRYYTLTPAVVEKAYAGLPSSYDTEVSEEGTSYEVKIGYGF